MGQLLTRKPRLQLVTDDTGAFATGRAEPPPGDALETGERESFVEARKALPPEPAPVPRDAPRPAANDTPPAPPARPSSKDERPRAAYVGRVPFGSREERMLRSFARLVALNALVFAGVSGTLLYRAWAESLPLLAALGGVAGIIALSHLRAAAAFRRVVVTDDRDAAHLAHGFSLLRGVFVWKGVTLFLLLALACFTLSIVVSFLALL